MISIHALAKRATYDGYPCIDLGTISIHALAKRATYFIPHYNFIVRISIHALAKRATINMRHVPNHSTFQSTPSQRGRHIGKLGGLFGKKDFNPRPRKEGDARQEALQTWKQAFQSTPSQRGRQARLVPVRLGKDFNPRPRKEGDRHSVSNRPATRNFNPRPRKEGDIIGRFKHLLYTLFQSTPS